MPVSSRGHLDMLRCMSASFWSWVNTLSVHMALEQADPGWMGTFYPYHRLSMFVKGKKWTTV